MGIETFTFIIVAIIAVLAAAGMLFSRNPVHSALFLIINLACVAFLYLMLSAPFMFAVQITVYAGAIMVLFLFVIMLLGAQEMRTGESRIRWQMPAAVVLSIFFVVTVVVALVTGQIPEAPAMGEIETATYGSPAQIGEVLFRDYLLPFEMVAVLLLSAMVGAVILSRTEEELDEAKKREKGHDFLSVGQHKMRQD